MRIPHTFLSSLISSLCLLLIYTLAISLFAPFVIKRVEASPLVEKNISEAISKRASRPVATKAQEQKSRWRAGELLVRFREDAPVSKISDLLKANGAKWKGQLRGQSGIVRLRLSAGSDPETIAVVMRASELIDFAEPNYLITADQISTDDPRISEQWALQSTGVSQAWGTTTGSKQTVIAVIDSGIDFTHPDLSQSEWNNTLEQANSHDDDSNSFADDLRGWDFITNSGGSMDERGHGTAVAGIIAAQGNNATGITGVMWRASLMSLRVLDNTGTGDIAGAVEAIDYATTNGAQVINCSWGTDDHSVALQEAISRAAKRGVVVVASAGNNSRDVETTPHYPASYNLPNLISVASTDKADLLAPFSNWGAMHVSIAAPGAEILTTKIGGDYQTLSGSSASAPFVSGVAGLIKTLRPWLGADRTREMIIRGARQVPSLSDKVASKGIVSASGAMDALNILPPNEGLDESDGNNGGERGNNGNGRRNQRDNLPDAGNTRGNEHRDGKEFSVTPPARTQGAPGMGLPNLDELRRKQPTNPKAADPVPSTRCSHHNPQCGKVKHQAAANSPTDLLAWVSGMPDLDSILGSASSQVTDSPFSIFSRTSSKQALDASVSLALSVPYASLLLPEPLVVLSAPTNLNATSASSTQINLTWTAPAGIVAYYQIERSQSISEPFLVIATSLTPSFSDSPTSGVNAYLYRVRAVNSVGQPSQPSNLVLATSITFMDDPLVAGVTFIKAQHLSELRQAVNAVRRVADLSDATWTDAATAGVSIKAVHVQELRDRLGEALAVLSVPTAAYTDPVLSTGSNGTPIRRAHIEELRQRSTRGSSSSSGPVDSSDDFSTARLDPTNRTGKGGVDLLSGNANWSLPILGLKGRAGLDLGLALSYNSLVWTKNASTNTIKFDADQGMPSPGFRLGFPVIQPRYYNSQVGKYEYLLITPSGGHVELRQVETSNIYESADSSYLQLIDNGSSGMTLRPTDGSQLLYELKNGQYHCKEIKDRNGNYISVSYHTDGRINTITDTLARIITFNYDGSLNLISITQDWGGTEPHKWATFGWTNTTINTSFSGVTIIGQQNGSVIPVLTSVSLSDGTYHKFRYNSWGQIDKVTAYAADSQQNGQMLDTHPLNYISYTFPTSTGQADCPRVTESRVWAENWNGLNGVPAEVVTQYSTAGDYSPSQMTMPDGTVYKELFGTSGWQKGLTTGTEVWSGGVKKKWTTTGYTQDDTNLSYQKNPRVIETNIYDVEGNRKRTTVDYGTYAQWGLPYLVKEYAADSVTAIRQTYTDYNLSQAYLDRRIIGLVSAVNVSDSAVQSKTTYAYDAGGSQLEATPTQTIRHDANYDATSTTVRGLLTSISRYDVKDISNETLKTVMQIGYDTNGSVIFTKDALHHETILSYADSFSDNNSRNTYAYPTKTTPPLAASGETGTSFSSTTQYNYYMGVVTRSQGPVPAGQTQGSIQTFEYDAAGRISKINNVNNGAYRRWVYDPSGAVSTFETINTVTQEAFSATLFDGAGRVRGTGGHNPNSTGGYRAQFTVYDAMGRASQSTNPAETNSNWIPAGDDTAGWVWTQQAYDWKGRPTLTTNPDGTTKEATHGGCGCAGGEVVTIRDEVGRRQRMTSDILGRPLKTEILNENGSVYSTVTNNYNARDQVTTTIEQAGTSGASQTTTLEYDGHGRLWKRQTPSQTAPSVYTYKLDDTVENVTDARGVVTAFTYNNRHQKTGISYTAPTGITTTAPVSYTYDAAGNRTAMTDGTGSTSYVYDQLSRLTSETRQFNEFSGTYKLTYTYNLSGALTNLTDEWGDAVGYQYDQAGRVTAVTGAGFANVSNYASNLKYRAWGAIKQMNYGNGLSLSMGYDSRLRATSYLIPGLLSKTYDYDADSRLHFSHDALNAKYDRSYTYDHVGRITQALSGAEARGEGATNLRPYSQTFKYDAFNHPTERPINQVWSRSAGAFSPSVQSYQNNRNTDWEYDAAGNLIDSGDVEYTIAAGGETARVVSNTSLGYNQESSVWGVTTDLEQKYDGQGVVSKKMETTTTHDSELGDETSSATTYLLRSSVLGGKVITEIDGLGQKTRGFVYLGESVLAWQNKSGTSEVVRWEHRDASNASFRITDQSAVVYHAAGSELDPLGTDAGLSDPNLVGKTWQNMSSYPGFGSSLASSDSQCMWDGVWLPCSIYQFALNSGYIQNPEQQRGFNSDNPHAPVRFDNAAEYADSIDSWRSPRWIGRSARADKGLREGFFARIPQKSDCSNFVDEILERAIYFKDILWGDIAGIGRGILKHALDKYASLPNDGSKKLAVDGFKHDLIKGGQRGNVYQHILAHAGATLIGDSYVLHQPWFGKGRVQAGETGFQLSDRELAQDRLDAKGANGHPIEEGEAEVFDDIAGRRIGTLLRNSLERNQDIDALRSKAFGMLCDK